MPHKVNLALDPPPIQEITTSPTGRFPQVWIRWLQSVARRILGLEETTNLLLRMSTSALIDAENDGQTSINAGDNTKFDITAGTLQFVDAYTDPHNPTYQEIDLGPFTAQTVTNLATENTTFIYIDTTGAIVQKSDEQTGAFIREHVGIALLVHVNRTNISQVIVAGRTVISNTIMSLADQGICQGTTNCVLGGQNIITGNSGTLGLDKSPGEWYRHGINSGSDNKNPNIIASAALVKPTMFIAWTVTDDENGKIIIQDTIPAGVYDDGTAVLADALPQGVLATNKWVNNRVFHLTIPNQIAVQIGTTTYLTAAAATLGVQTETFNIIPAFIAATPIATVTMRGGAADLSLLADAEMRQAIPPRATFQ